MGSDFFYASPFFWASMAGLCAGMGLGRLFVPSRSRRNPAHFRSRGWTVCFLCLSAACGSCLAGFFLCPHGYFLDVRLVYAASGFFVLGFLGRLFPGVVAVPSAILFSSAWAVAIVATMAWAPIAADGALLRLVATRESGSGYAVSLTVTGVGGRQSITVKESRLEASVSRLVVPDWAQALGVRGGWRLLGLSGSGGSNRILLPSAPIDFFFPKTLSSENAIMRISRYVVETPELRDYDRLAVMVTGAGVEWKRE